MTIAQQSSYFLVKYLPSWVPFQRRAAHGKDMIAKLVNMPFEKVKQDMVSDLFRATISFMVLIMHTHLLSRTPVLPCLR